VKTLAFHKEEDKKIGGITKNSTFKQAECFSNQTQTPVEERDYN
jgi:hypothetical protein